MGSAEWFAEIDGAQGLGLRRDGKAGLPLRGVDGDWPGDADLRAALSGVQGFGVNRKGGKQLSSTSSKDSLVGIKNDSKGSSL